MSGIYFEDAQKIESCVLVPHLQTPDRLNDAIGFNLPNWQVSSLYYNKTPQEFYKFENDPQRQWLVEGTLSPLEDIYIPLPQPTLLPDKLPPGVEGI